MCATRVGMAPADQSMDKAGTVLVVDDNPGNLRVLFEYLEESGLEVSVAGSGERALQQLKRFHPDIILLDVIMPGIDGFETCRRLKRNAATRDIPVIFLTALVDSVNKVKGFLAGGADYITKPLQYEEVLARITAHLRIRRMERKIRTLEATLADQSRQLEEQQQSIDASAQMQSTLDRYERLLACISSDLEQPFHKFMRSIRALVDNIDEYGKNEFKGRIHRIEADAEELYASHENLLIWVAHQRGFLEYTPQLIDLHELVAYNIAKFTPMAEKKRITFSSAVRMDTMVYADYNMIDIILRNLFSNAITFTETLGNVRTAVAEEAEMFEISISDSGIGMDADRITAVFQDKPYIRGEDSVGLGLLLCRELAERHNGRIWCASELGEGTTVTFTLPKVQSENDA